MKTSIQYLYLALCAILTLSLGACGTDNYTGWDMFGTKAGVVTNNPSSRPDIAWQTHAQRQDLSKQSAAQQTQPVLPNPQRTLAPPAAPMPAFTVHVALLLPLTGKHADIGQSMLKAAQMALFDVGSTNFSLVPHDTRSTDQGALAAAQDAVAENDAMILGPVFASAAKIVKPVAAGAQIPMLSFTTDWTVAGNGAYVMGFLPFAQVSRVIAFAQSKGYHSFAAYAPKTPYADVVIDALRHTTANLVKIGRYDPAQTDISDQIQTFADETVLSKDDKGKPASFFFDALVLPVGNESLRGLVSLLGTAGINNSKVRLIGTGLWDDDSLTKSPALYGGWFAAPDPALRRDFEKRYAENYGTAPLRVSSLAYDATALAAVLARTGGTAPYTEERLDNPRGFAGIDGLFRLRHDGLTEHGLAVLEIEEGKTVVVDPAPTAFLPSGS